MSFFPGKDPVPSDPAQCEAIKDIIAPRSVDIDGLVIQRALPSTRTRLVGPFIFFDHFGPAVFRSGAGSADELATARKAAAGCIGIAGAVGAYGGFFIPRGFAMAKESFGSLVPALWVFVAAYVVMAATTWAVYQRRGAALARESI